MKAQALRRLHVHLATADWLWWLKAAALALTLVLPTEGGLFWPRLSQIAGDAHGWLGVTVFLALFALSTAALVVTAFLPSFLIRLLLALVIVPSTLASTVNWSVTGKTLAYDNIGLWWEERGLAGGALRAYAHEVPYMGLVAGVCFLALLLPPGKKLLSRLSTVHSVFPRGVPRRLLGVTPYATAFGIFPVLGLLNIVQGGEGLMGLPVHYKGSTFLSTMALNKQFVEKERTISATGISLMANRGRLPNVLFVVNESVRGDYLDVNHNQGVTPYLYSHRQRIQNFGYASSIANCSRSTHQGFRVGINMDKPVESQRSNPFIWQYAQMAGYRTLYIDTQVAPGKLNNNVSSFERAMIDEYHYLNDPDHDEHGVWSRDERALKMVNRMLAEADPAQPSFIYLVQYGAHTPYDDKYPPRAQHYPIHDELSRRERTINSYKNAVRWSVDTFFETMLKDDRRFPDTVIIYTADHGEDLMDRASAAVHCTVHDPVPHEGLVPLLTLTDHPLWQERLAAAASTNKNKASHFNIVPTILELFGFEVAGINQYHGLTLRQVIDRPRKFLSRGIRINVASLGREKKLLWNTLPKDWLAAGAPVGNRQPGTAE